MERRYYEIKQYFHLLPPEKMSEILEFLDFLVKKYVPKEKRVKSLEGIWSNIDIKKIENIEKELKMLRKEMESDIIRSI